MGRAKLLPGGRSPMPDVLVPGAYGGAYEDASGALKLWAHAVARGAAAKIVQASGSRGGGW